MLLVLRCVGMVWVFRYKLLTDSGLGCVWVTSKLQAPNQESQSSAHVLVLDTVWFACPNHLKCPLCLLRRGRKTTAKPWKAAVFSDMWSHRDFRFSVRKQIRVGTSKLILLHAASLVLLLLHAASRVLFLLHAASLVQQLIVECGWRMRSPRDRLLLSSTS